MCELNCFGQAWNLSARSPWTVPRHRQTDFGIIAYLENYCFFSKIHVTNNFGIPIAKIRLSISRARPEKPSSNILHQKTYRCGGQTANTPIIVRLKSYRFQTDVGQDKHGLIA